MGKCAEKKLLALFHKVGPVFLSTELYTKIKTSETKKSKVHSCLLLKKDRETRVSLSCTNIHSQKISQIILTQIYYCNPNIFSAALFFTSYYLGIAATHLCQNNPTVLLI